MLAIQKVLNYSSKDIKDVSITEDYIICGGRDDKVFVTNRKNDTTTSFNPNNGHINALECVNDTIYCGFQNGNIKSFGLDGSLKKTFTGHTSNVCTLQVYGDILISGSWDHHMHVWNINDQSTIYFVEHPSTVWCVKQMKDDRIITGCADRNIRIYNKTKLELTISFHNFCVRDIDIKDGFIYSVDNEGIILKTTLEGELVCHKSFKEFLYSVKVLKDGIICCGENGKIYFLNEKLELQHQVSASCTSCWKVVEYDNKMYVCGSDGSVYVYSIHTVQATPILDGQPKSEKEFSTNGERYKEVDNKIYQFVDNEWVFIGEKNGQTDHSFSIELDGKYYTLSFNDNDNLYEVTEAFLSKNRINFEYKHEIVQYIKQNFKKDDFIKYETVNKEGVYKYIVQYGNRVKNIIKNIDQINLKDGVLVEEELIWLFNQGPKFVSLDLYRYFIVCGMSFNFIFLFKYLPADRKESLAFIRLLTILYINPPFSLENFHSVVMKLRDVGHVKREDLSDYYTNREASLKKYKRQ